MDENTEMSDAPTKVTAEMVRECHMGGIAFIDGAAFYRCSEFPELLRVVEGPRGRSKVQKTDIFKVGNEEVPRPQANSGRTIYDAIADAINAHREKKNG